MPNLMGDASMHPWSNSDRGFGMTSLISSSHLRTLLHEADGGARRAVRRLHAPHLDLDDIRQDLLLDLIRRIPAFDSGRGALGAFAGKVIAHRVARTARVAIRERSLFGIVPTSLDEPVPDADGLTRGDLVAEGNGYGALFGQSPDRIAEVDRRLDLARGL